MGRLRAHQIELSPRVRAGVSPAPVRNAVGLVGAPVLPEMASPGRVVIFARENREAILCRFYR
jgi:hypothetical protein